MTTEDERNAEEVRCVCSSRTLLAVVGRDPSSGVPFVHVKALRNREPYTEVVVKGGTTAILCRSCGRWFTVRIAQDDFWTSEGKKPSVIEG